LRIRSLIKQRNRASSLAARGMAVNAPTDNSAQILKSAACRGILQPVACAITLRFFSQ